MTVALRDDRIRAIMRWLMAAFYVAAGIAHLAIPEPFLRITPSVVPFAPQVILLTGLCELAGAIALVTKPMRRWAGIALAAYAVCVWPANFKHAIEVIDLPFLGSSWLYHGPRLAFQPVLIWWALYSAGLTDWPWHRKA
ncbi:DoxX family protein [Bradyrhizobium ontarionense]|uniref:DoxX family protein n=1 Tax=Bradyrhizobium ontarionense TaxID=2898149 RepID=A0ABY3RA98_9BRAD|nr:DoxX family protein [Bradyrhizobium sp. A19]UFZ03870.1 DoxX family protein [Bradyrhizobium sp. A19]